MKRQVAILALSLAFASPGPMLAFAPQDEDVRGAFLTTRPKASGKAKPSGTGTRPSRRRPKVTVAKPQTGNVVAVEPKTTTPKVAVQRLGIGLTLFMRDTNGLSVRVDPSREFRKGDHVRVLLETNVDGYLYIFNTTDDGMPLMIYPDAELEEAGNFIKSHVPVEIPSSLAPEERLKWFTFDANPGLEKLHFVFTREPLAGVPIEDDLITYCRANAGECPWTPGTALWARIKKEAADSVQNAKPTGLGKAQTEAEQLGATRGIGLNRDDAEPSLILLSASTSSDMLVATLALVHKVASLVVEDEITPALQVDEEPRH